MIISHTNKFIFLRPFKTGSTSVQQALALGACGAGDWISCVWLTEAERARLGEAGATIRKLEGFKEICPPEDKAGGRNRYVISPAGQNLYLGLQPFHPPAAQVQALDPKAWESYAKLTIVRNPWDHALSIVHYWHLYRFGAEGVEDWLSENSSREILALCRKGFATSRFVFDAQGRPQCSTVLKFENLEADFADFSRRSLGLELPLPHFKKFQYRTGPYMDYYDQRARDAVAKAFAPEISTFGYRFGV
jgi:hypothetical protein